MTESCINPHATRNAGSIPAGPACTVGSGPSSNGKTRGHKIHGLIVDSVGQCNSAHSEHCSHKAECCFRPWAQATRPGVFFDKTARRAVVHPWGWPALTAVLFRTWSNP